MNEHVTHMNALRHLTQLLQNSNSSTSATVGASAEGEGQTAGGKKIKVDDHNENSSRTESEEGGVMGVEVVVVVGVRDGVDDKWARKTLLSLLQQRHPRYICTYTIY